MLGERKHTVSVFCLGVVRNVCGSVLGLLCCSCILTHHGPGFLEVTWMICCTVTVLLERICMDTQPCVGLQPPKTISIEKCLGKKCAFDH